ncbi:MAG: hypothetical protein E7651_03940 [Ruminococcaceae bacterium]|nr:hypothetical protein [Oscillospiraceae bacterium]MBQ8323873.1 hypothetical protein [Clostridia bacterium]
MKNYVGQKFTANLLKDKEGFGGIMTFFDDRLEFEAFFKDQLPHKLVIRYGDIHKVAAVMTCGIIPNGLNVWTDEGETFRFAIWHRKKIAAFLRGKAGV